MSRLQWLSPNVCIELGIAALCVLAVMALLALITTPRRPLEG